MITILLKLLRFVSWPNKWSVLENVPRALAKNVHSVIISYSYVFVHEIRYLGLYRKTENTGIPSNV